MDITRKKPGMPGFFFAALAAFFIRCQRESEELLNAEHYPIITGGAIRLGHRAPDNSLAGKRDG